MEKRQQETTIEVITTSLLILGGIRDALAMTFGGLVLLGSGISQSRKGWHVSLLTCILELELWLGGIGVRMFLITWPEIN